MNIKNGFTEFSCPSVMVINSSQLVDIVSTPRFTRFNTINFTRLGTQLKLKVSNGLPFMDPTPMSSAFKSFGCLNLVVSTRNTADSV